MDLDLAQPWMLFVDGENLTMRGQRFASDEGLHLVAGRSWVRDTFLWTPIFTPWEFATSVIHARGRPAPPPIRAHYYTSVSGAKERMDGLRSTIRDAGFEPAVFWKSAQQTKAKGVDIALARDLLVHAVDDHFKWAVLVTGDEDYLPLVEEVKRRGKIVVLAFFSSDGLSDRLRVAADHFVPLDRVFSNTWLEYGNPLMGNPSLSADVAVAFRGRRTHDDVMPDAPDTVTFSEGDNHYTIECPKGVTHQSGRAEFQRLYDKAREKHLLGVLKKDEAG